MLTKDKIEALAYSYRHYGEYATFDHQGFAAAVIAAHTAKVLGDVEPSLYTATVNGGYQMLAKSEPPDDAYDAGTLERHYPAHTVAVLKSERDALAARVAELAAALLKCRDMVEHPDNVAFIDAALAAKGQA